MRAICAYVVQGQKIGARSQGWEGMPQAACGAPNAWQYLETHGSDRRLSLPGGQPGCLADHSRCGSATIAAVAAGGGFAWPSPYSHGTQSFDL